MSQRTKKPRLDKSDDEEYSDQDFRYGEELSSLSPREERGDTDVEISDSSESFQLSKVKGSEGDRKRKQRHYRRGQGEQPHRGHSDYRKSRYDDSDSRKRERISHSRSPLPSRSSGRDRPLRGESLKRESSSGRNSPMYLDERSRDSLREERFVRDVEYEDSRYHERSSGSTRLLTVRQESRYGERRGSREQKEMYERGSHHIPKNLRHGSNRGGERGGPFSLHRDDRRGSLRVGRSPKRHHEHLERSRSSRPDIPIHHPRSIGREQRRERHENVREERRERHHKVHRQRSGREAMEEERGSMAASVETIAISSGSGDEVVSGGVRSEGSATEKIDDLIRDLESGSSSGEITEEESEKEEAREEENEEHSLSEKDKSSDGGHSPSDSRTKSHVMRSKFDSDPDSESEEESRARPLERRGFSGYHDIISSEEDRSEVSDIEQPEAERAGEKESDLSAQLSRELDEVEQSPIPEERPCYLPALMGCRNVEENYDYLNKIEEGTYGVVHRAKDKQSGKIFALKRLKLENEKEGFPITSLREIDMLLKAKHPNIVGVREIVLGKNMDRIYIVFEYVEHDLKELMETMKQPFLQGEVKTLMIQLLRAVHHLHDNWIIHRDLKASNLLVSHQAILKVADFGLAREYGSPLRKYTPIVVTLWYRSPELLLGAPEYSTPVDLWSVGCIFAEMMLQKPLFQGKGEIDQLNQIFKLLGTPNEQIWSGYNELPTVKKVSFTNQPYNHLRKKFPPSLLTQNGFDLLNRFLTYDPKKRITAKDALDHPYFKEPPMPIPPSMFNTWPAKSELGHKKKAKSPTPPVGGAFQFAEDGPGFNLKF